MDSHQQASPHVRRGGSRRRYQIRMKNTSSGFGMTGLNPDVVQGKLLIVETGTMPVQPRIRSDRSIQNHNPEHSGGAAPRVAAPF
jgi:hypothetical protein